MKYKHTSPYEDLISWVEDIKVKNGSSGAALYILKDDQVVLEHYSGKHSHAKHASPVNEKSQFNIASARKSYLGLAVSYALYDQFIKSLDDPISLYIPELDEELFKGTTIRHLVTHSHGLDYDEEGTIIREFTSGKSWAYRSVGVDIMTRLIHRLYGIGFAKLLEERVFKPMGLKETGWRTERGDNLVGIIEDIEKPALSGVGTTSDGTEKNLFVSSRELALWGQLHLNKGIMNQKEIVPSQVIEVSTTIQNKSYSDPTLPENGLFWYVQNIPRNKGEIGERVPKGSYQILGVTGPTILVIPSLNVVVAKMYNKRYNYGEDQYLYYLREFSNKVSDLFSTHCDL